VASDGLRILTGTAEHDGTGAQTGRVVPFPGGASSDDALFEGLLAGRPAAIADLFDRHAPTVRRLLTRMLSDASEADDLAQETFLVVVRRARDIRRPEAVRSFVVATAIRMAKNELRRRAIRRFIGLDEAQPPLVVDPHDAEVREQVERLQAVLQDLGTDARALFLLRHVERLELTELSSAFGCSLATIKRRLTRVEARFMALARSDAALQELLPREEAR
jgi:RNA polymerase sigma-70 factor (ECF subfamily)